MKTKIKTKFHPCHLLVCLLGASSSLYAGIEDPIFSSPMQLLREGLSEERMNRDVDNETADVIDLRYVANFVSTQSLSQRMSELHKAQSGGNMWGRVSRGYVDGFENDNLDNSKLENVSLQIGGDKVVHSTRDENVVVGAFGEFSRNRLNYNVPELDSSRITTYGTGVYATYKNESGVYVDTTLRYQRMRTELNRNEASDGLYENSGHSNGYGASVEVGRRFTAKKDNDSLAQVYWFVEPQLQFNYSHQDKVDMGSTVFSSFNSLLGRAGVNFGYSIINSELDIVDLYLNLGYVREFQGDTSYTYFGETQEYRFRGGYFDSQFGINYELFQNVSFYFDIRYTRGSLFTNRTFNFGVRYYY